MSTCISTVKTYMGTLRYKLQYSTSDKHTCGKHLMSSGCFLVGNSATYISSVYQWLVEEQQLFSFHF